MKNWRFAITRRWFGYLAFAIVFAIGCGLLSNWQVARSKEAADANALVARNFNASARPLDDVLPDPGSWRDSDQWKRVTLTGHYDRSAELLVRNRPNDAGTGFEVLTPLRLADGRLFMVDRGWIASRSSSAGPVKYPPATPGEVTVTVRLKQSEPTLNNQTAVGNQIASIDLSVVRARMPRDTLYTGAYGLLESQSPTPASPLTPVITTPPTADEGLHWSYAIQWVIFAAIGFFGLGYALRKEYRMRNADDPEERTRAAERDRRRVAKRTDADVEDELVDQAAGR